MKCNVTEKCDTSSGSHVDNVRKSVETCYDLNMSKEDDTTSGLTVYNNENNCVENCNEIDDNEYIIDISTGKKRKTLVYKESDDHLKGIGNALSKVTPIISKMNKMANVSNDLNNKKINVEKFITKPKAYVFKLQIINIIYNLKMITQNENVNMVNQEYSHYALPSICNNVYSTLTRSRRASTIHKYKTIPSKYRNSVIECVEFPNGVYINENGIPMPHISVSNLLYDDSDEILQVTENEDADEEFENRQYDNDCKKGTEKYEGVTSDEDDTDYELDTETEVSDGSISDSTEMNSDSDVFNSDSDVVEDWQFFSIR